MLNIKSLAPSIVAIAALFSLNGQNLIPNSGFEDDTTAPLDKPDYYRYRFSDYHHVETDSANVYQGSKCALFNNTTSSTVSCYYYACYSADGTTENFLNVKTGCEYELTVKYRTDAAFTGAGISIQIIFCEDGVTLGDAVSIEYKSTTWDTIRITGKAKGRVNQIFAAVYYKGIGKAWVDNLELKQIDTPLLKNGSFEVESAVTSGLPEDFLARSTTLSSHYLETELENTYLGNKTALFDAVSNNACYYYGAYDTSGGSYDYIPVCPGDSYKISGYGRVASAFTGNGVRLSMIYWDGSTYVNRDDSSYLTSTSWEPLSKVGTIPAGANNLTYSAEYSGQNEGWLDEVYIIKDNLITNSCFETDSTAPTDTPDYWLSRSTTASYHSIETNASLVYEGSASALFNNTTQASEACYYYGPVKAESATYQFLNAREGEEYTLTAYGKVDSNFSGSGIRISVIYWNNGTYVDRDDSVYSSPSTWTQLSLNSTVPEGATQMTYSIEYDGCNKAWFDKVELKKTDDLWYYNSASIDTLESTNFSTPTAKTLTNIQDEFEDHHDSAELVYNNDGSWDVGYGTAPLVRASANAVLGYLAAHGKFTDTTLKATFESRAEAALEWLLDEQLASGAFPYYRTSTPETSGGAVMYESGLAGAALIAGYLHFDDVRYLDASNDLCDYLITINPSSNANFNSFAVFALVENYKVTSTQAYLDKALLFLDCMMTFQLDSGMWADEHNQYAPYQGINMRGVAMTLAVLPSNHPKKAVLEHALYKGLNHIIRSTPNKEGWVWYHPIYGGIIYSSSCMAAICVAYDELGMTGLSDMIKANTLAATYLTTDTIQGYSLEAIGLLLKSYY